MGSLKHCQARPVYIENGKGTLMHRDILPDSRVIKSKPSPQHTIFVEYVVLRPIHLAKHLLLDLRTLSCALTKAVFVSFLDVGVLSSSIAQINLVNTALRVTESAS